MGFSPKDLKQYTIPTPLTGFTGNTVYPMGFITIPVIFGQAPKTIATSIEFLVIDISSVYNAILGRRTLHYIRAIPSIYHLKIKFPAKNGIGEEKGCQDASRECYKSSRGHPRTVHILHNTPKPVIATKVLPSPEDLPD